MGQSHTTEEDHARVNAAALAQSPFPTLPIELVQLILVDHRENDISILVCRAVCKSWRTLLRDYAGQIPRRQRLCAYIAAHGTEYLPVLAWVRQNGCPWD